MYRQGSHPPLRRGEAVWFDGGLLTITVAASDTGGAFTVFEYIAERGKASPLHSHPDADETFWVLEGDIKVPIDGVEHEGANSATFVFRRNVPHAYAITSERARILMMLTPGGGVNFFFRQAGVPAGRRDLPPPSQRNLEQFQAAAAGSGVVSSGLHRSTWRASTRADSCLTGRTQSREHTRLHF